MNRNYFLFNFTEATEIQLLTKYERNLELTDQEEQIKGKEHVRQKLNKSLENFIGRMQIPIYS